MYGPEMYELTRYLQADRMGAADARRAINRSAGNRYRRATQSKEPQGQWTLEWAGNGFTGTQVTLMNEATGQRLTGRHPFDWDQALGTALQETGLLT